MRRSVLALALFLIFPAAVLSLGLKSTGTVPLRALRTTRLHSGSLSLGSDMLERPDDEDSPEFKEYLKALLAMQANRAKTGHASPSSASADAYLAKLNRIKLERNMRREAGLPDDDVDTSKYVDSDYKNAMFEGAEPLVTGGDSGGRKVRVMSKEEKALQEEVQARVMAAVKGSVAPKAKPFTPNRDLAAKIPMSEEQSKLIDEFMAKAPRKPVAPQAPSSPVLKAQVAAPVAPRPEASRADPVPAAKSAPPDASFNAVLERAKVNSAMQVAAAEVAKQPTGPVKKLGIEDLDKAARVLQLLVRHRGGGPFGAGRLQGEEAKDLADALRDAEAMLKKDFDDFAALKPAAKPVAVTPPPVAKDVGAKQPAPPAPATLKPEPKVAVKVPTMPATVPQASKPAPAPAAVGPVVKTIAQGLDAFLLDPSKIGTQDLEGLRDGIIQCLGLIQNEVVARQRGSISPAPASPAAAPQPEGKPAPPLQHDESMEQQLKLALGMLLKHRGGPGFGHGRLQGRELDVLEERLKKVAAALSEESLASDGSNVLQLGK